MRQADYWLALAAGNLYALKHLIWPPPRRTWPLTMRLLNHPSSRAHACSNAVSVLAEVVRAPRHN